MTNKHNWLTDLLLLLLCVSAFYALFLGSHPLLVPDEGRYSEVAREMIVSGNYLTPHLNGTVLMDKPVLYYWLEVSAIKAFGLHEWALRLWPALFGVFGCLFTYVAGRILFDRRTGVLAAVMLATSPLHFCLAHYANLDIEVAVFIGASLLSFIVGATGRSPLFFYLSYIFAGLAILTKGLIGIIFPVLIIGLWVLLLQRWRTLKEMRLLSGLLITFIIAAPWYLLMQKTHPDFLHYFFITQQFTRYLSTDFNNAEPFWFYVPIVLVGLFPWILFLPQTIKQNIQLIRQNKQQYQVKLFFLIWPLVIFIFFSLPHSKTIGYMVPIVPPLALLMANYLSQRWEQIKKWFVRGVVFNAVALLTLAAAMPYLNQNTVKPLAMQLKQYLQPNDEVVSYYYYYYDLPLYLQRQVKVVANWQAKDIATNDNWEHELWQGSSARGATIQLLDDATFLDLWHSAKQVFVFTNDRNLPRFKRLVNDKFFLVGQYEGDVFLLSNYNPRP